MSPQVFARQSFSKASSIRCFSVAKLWRASQSGPRSIRASDAEAQAGRLSERNLEIAVRHVLKDGLVVIENAIDHKVLDELNRKMVQDAIFLANKKEGNPFNYNKGNIQQDAPPVKKYFDPSIFMSEYRLC